MQLLEIRRHGSLEMIAKIESRQYLSNDGFMFIELAYKKDGRGVNPLHLC